ncbi:MAG: radical SAM/Cys-rich domain protein [marine bacterium B5-7]|nr:MAG: radical SAM/Cys-rich domain protein [marine bacterium B5-7]
MPQSSAAMFRRQLTRHGITSLKRATLSTLQINTGRLCNQACEHCHVDAGPKRTEIMSRDTMARIVNWCAQNKISDIDITGGAPEMNPGFRHFVEQLLQLNARVMVRCNLTILEEPGFEDLADWYVTHRIPLVCSLPCYSQENVDGQRGKGVFEKSITALKRLNARGYGSAEGPTLDLVYNPAGAFLPPPQDTLERQYKQELASRYGIVFNRLFALANLPINRFKRYLNNNDQLESYKNLLVDAFNPSTISGLMCRHLVSVDWQGYLYDCDFNQMLDMPLPHGHKRPALWDIDAAFLENRPVAIADHCFGCTAGTGSSCGGSLAE